MGQSAPSAGGAACKQWKTADGRVAWAGPTGKVETEAPAWPFIGDDSEKPASQGGNLVVKNHDSRHSIFVTSTAAGLHETEVPKGAQVRYRLGAYFKPGENHTADISIRFCAY